MYINHVFITIMHVILITPCACTQKGKVIDFVVVVVVSKKIA